MPMVSTPREEPPMSLEEFKQSLDTRWERSFERIPPEYRRRVCHLIRTATTTRTGRRREEDDYYPLTRGLAENILVLGRTHTDQVPTILETITTLAHHPRTADHFLDRTREILDKVDEQTYKSLGEIIIELEHGPGAYDDLAAQYLNHTISSLVEKAPAHIGIVLDHALYFAKCDAPAAHALLFNTPQILSNTEPERYIRLCSIARKLSASSQKAPTRLLESAASFRPRVFSTREANTPDAKTVFDTILEATEELAGQDPDQACDFFDQTPRLLQTLAPNQLDKNHLLLEHIHDPYSANIVGKLIDREKYRKEYAEKCQTFYKGTA